MEIIDTHSDTLIEIFENKENLYKNNLHIDIKRMKRYSSYCQFFACFTHPKQEKNAKKYAVNAFSFFKEELLKNKEHIGLATNFREYCDLKSAGKITAFFSMENADAINRICDLDLFYNLGVRMISLTWNFDNALATGVLGDEKRGVTEFGKQVIENMEEKNIILDVSHLNEKSFWDIAELFKKPFVASHSNSYYVCNNKRNLTDEEFLEIKRRGGYVGMNFYPLFLTGEKNAKISDILKMTEHFLALGGENIIGIGSDFDGVDCLPKGIFGVEHVEKIFNEMAKIGYSDEIMDKIAHKNFEKIIKLF